MKDKSKRRMTWFNTDLPLVSDRVKIILSNPTDSNSLSKSIRNNRKHENSSFTLTEKTIMGLNDQIYR